ncbi:MAG: M3 family metallopeptidase [Bryobacterales bacterium]|nr:M3 family metallopeptidase [Bryobacterales bacterium]
MRSLTIFLAVLCVANAQTGGLRNMYQNWSGPHGGVPPFDKVRIPELRTALESAIAETLRNLDRIAQQTEPATFENTIAALERADDGQEYVQSIYGVWKSNMSSDEFRPVQTEMEPKLAAARDKMLQNGALFHRVAKVYENMAPLNAEQQRLVWDMYTDFVRAGAKLAEDKKKRIAEINQRLAGLYTKFSNNLLHDEENYVLYLKKEQLGGLAGSFVQAAAAAAKQRGHDGEYAILNTRSSVEPFLTDSTERALREKVWRTFYSRGDNGDEYDNNAVIVEILKLRAERTTLQGYKTFADRAIEKQMAKKPAAAMELMMKLWPAAIARVKEEVADMQAIADREGAKIKIAAWDYRFYAEKVRKAKYDLDSREVMEYLQLEKLREGMMWAAGKAYGFEFAPVANVPVFHEDVRVWEVKRKGKHVGLWYFDPYARKGKRSGAWMTAYRKQSRMDGERTTLVSNNSNFVKGAAGEPVLISWTDAETMFHEFGHAIHGLSSSVTYGSLAGTSVARDYVEFPSQINEYFLSAAEVLERFAVHYKTGKPMPAELLKKIENADKFNQGFATTEFLASALVDMKVHMIANPDGIDPDAYERETLAGLKMPEELPMRHRMPQFSHIFSSEGYAAGYYSYLWADALTADAWEAFEEGKGAFDQDVAGRFYENVLSKGNTVDPAMAYRKFRGRDVDTNALMRDRGFAVK